jgi:hypothetical protein
MKKRYVTYLFRGLLSGGALAFGISVVWISLLFSVPAHSQEINRASLKQFYWDSEILPDHILYPVLMVADRVQLSLAEPEDKVYLQVLFAYQRLESSRQLLEKGEEALALSTLTKSQKYLLGAAHGVLELTAVDSERDEMELEVTSEVIGAVELDASGADSNLEEVREHVLKAFHYHLRDYALLQSEFKELDTSVIVRLIEEARVLEEQVGK